MFKLNEKIMANYSEEDRQRNKYYKHSDLFLELMNIKPEQVSFNHIFLCGFNIDNEGKYPFIHFLLMEKNSEYGLIELDKNEFTDKRGEDIIKKCIDKLNELNMNIKSDYIGSYHYNNNLYIFLKIYERSINSYKYEKYINDCILDEIINIKKVYNTPINEETQSFFMENIELFLLYDERNKQYEIPSCFFVKRENPVVQNSRSLYGSKGGLFSILGPYYYFTNYKNAYIENKQNIVRFAVFVGKQLVKMNYPEDEIDSSHIKQTKLKESDLMKIKKEMLTVRITDYDGIWKNYYDSVYIGNIVLDDGTKYENNCVCVVHDKSRCILLSNI
jgi:hypothetical protein